MPEWDHPFPKISQPYFAAQTNVYRELCHVLHFNPLYPLLPGLSGPVLPLSSSCSCGSLLIRDSKACLTPGPIQTHRVRQRCLILHCTTTTPPPPSDPLPPRDPSHSCHQLTPIRLWPCLLSGPGEGTQTGVRLGRSSLSGLDQALSPNPPSKHRPSGLVHNISTTLSYRDI